MKVDPFQRDIVGWGVIGVVAVALGYVVIKWVIPAIANAAASSAANAAGSLTSGAANTVGAALNGLSNNQLTSSQTDLTGSNVNYSGFGPASSLGAAVNGLTGGAAASGGESIGSGLFSLFGSSPSGSSVYYTVNFPDGSKHAIGDATIDSNNRFTYNGAQYILGDDGSGNKIATALTTVYGSGSGGGIPTDFGVDPNSWG
jgi:hypothetical protein